MEMARGEDLDRASSKRDIVSFLPHRNPRIKESKRLV
jgi:hypothetical protein